MRLRVIRSLQLFGLVVLGSIAIGAQTPANGVHFTAATENVSGAGEPIKINLTSWSTDAQRDAFVDAWNMKTPPAAQGRGRGARGGAGSGGRGGRGARAGRGSAAAPAATAAADPDAVDANNPAFRFGRGGARGGAAADDGPKETPQGSLAAAVKKATTVGILWTSENVGYSIKYAYRLPEPDGGERVILVTDRRIGEWSNLWKPAASAPPTPDYKFSVIELHLNAKGEGEGKGPVSGKVMVDGGAKTIALDGYAALPVVFKGVKKLGS